MPVENSLPTDNVTLFERTGQTAPAKPQQLSAETANHTILFINFWASILNARLLAVMALVGALFMWAWTVYDPTVLRLWASGLYSLVLWPVMYLYAKRGT